MLRQRGNLTLAIVGFLVALIAVAYMAHSSREQEKAERLERLERQAKAQRDQELAIRQKAEAEVRRKAEEAQARLDAARQEQERERLAAARQELEAGAALVRLQSYLQRFDDANAVANSTPKIALAQPVMLLQSIRRETAAVSVPDCLFGTKGAMLSAMDEYIAGYLAFMSQSGDQADAAVRRRFAAARSHISAIVSRANRCKA